MFAVIQTGGKQYKVALGDRLCVEKLAAEVGETVKLPEVLMFADGKDVQFGRPLLDVPVQGQVLRHARGPKIRVVKFKRRKDYRRTQGHRQAFTELQITAIGKHQWSAPKSQALPEPKAEAEPKAKAQSKPEAAPKAKAAAKPKAADKPKAAAKPKAADKPKTATKSKAPTKPKAKAGGKDGA